MTCLPRQPPSSSLPARALGNDGKPGLKPRPIPESTKVFLCVTPFQAPDKNRLAGPSPILPDLPVPPPTSASAGVPTAATGIARNHSPSPSPGQIPKIQNRFSASPPLKHLIKSGLPTRLPIRPDSPIPPPPSASAGVPTAPIEFARNHSPSPSPGQIPKIQNQFSASPPLKHLIKRGLQVRLPIHPDFPVPPPPSASAGVPTAPTGIARNHAPSPSPGQIPKIQNQFSASPPPQGLVANAVEPARIGSLGRIVPRGRPPRSTVQGVHGADGISAAGAAPRAWLTRLPFGCLAPRPVLS